MGDSDSVSLHGRRQYMLLIVRSLGTSKKPSHQVQSRAIVSLMMSNRLSGVLRSEVLLILLTVTVRLARILRMIKLLTTATASLAPPTGILKIKRSGTVRLKVVSGTVILVLCPP